MIVETGEEEALPFLPEATNFSPAGLDMTCLAPKPPITPGARADRHLVRESGAVDDGLNADLHIAPTAMGELTAYLADPAAIRNGSIEADRERVAQEAQTFDEVTFA